MPRQAMRSACLLLVVSSMPSAVLSADPTCPYCTCEYNGPSFKLHSLKGHPVTKDLQCQDWCEKHHPVLLNPSDCFWDPKSSSCYTSCAGCALPKGGCYGTSSSKCHTYKTPSECDAAPLEPKGCSCALKKGFDSCKPCYQCQCTYTMGKVILNVSDTHNVLATPEICEKRCKENGKSATGWWGACTSTYINHHLGCNTAGCDSNCTYIADTCKPRDQYCWDPYPGETKCTCPLTNSEVAPNCPTTIHPPVVPSGFGEDLDLAEEHQQAGMSLGLGESGELALPEGADSPPKWGKVDVCPSGN